MTVRLAFVGLIAGALSGSNAAVGAAPADDGPGIAVASPRPDPTVTPTPAPVEPSARPAVSGSPAPISSPSGSTPPAEPRRFVVLGDSLSAWVFLTDDGQPSSAGAWPALVPRRDHNLALAHNSGVPGNTTFQMLARMNRDVFAYSPDLLFILGGTNDVASMIPDATIVDNIRQMVAAARERGIEAVVLTVPPNNLLSPARLRHYQSVNAALVTLGVAENVPIIDVYSLLARDDGGLNMQFAAPDGLHLNAAGAGAIADAVCEFMDPAEPPPYG